MSAFIVSSSCWISDGSGGFIVAPLGIGGRGCTRTKSRDFVLLDMPNSLKASDIYVVCGRLDFYLQIESKGANVAAWVQSPENF
jgi:hypothetical protein